MNHSSRWLGAMTLFVCSSSFAHAQVVTGPTVEGGLSISGPISNGYMPFTSRYNYNDGGSFIYLNGDSRRIAYLDYLDRADRAEKFGYRMPVDPYFGPSAAVRYPSTQGGWLGGGFGLWRRR